MKKLSIFCLTLLFIACSSDSEEPEIINQPDDEVVVEEEMEEENEQEEENQIELFSFSLQVNGEYFDDLVSGTLYLSDVDGNVLAQKELVNNSINLIEIEVDAN